MERRLGRGLGSLLGTAPATEEEKAGASEVPLDRIETNPHQPRTHFDAGALEELRDSIRRHGVLQPILLRAHGDGYQLISGERRWRASRLAGLKTIPAIVREEVSEQQMIELALVENVQRRDLGAIEKAKGYREMMDRLGITQEQVAEAVGLKRSTVTNHLRLLELPPKAQEAVEMGLISMGHARALLGIEASAKQLDLVERISREGLSVRQVEAAVRQLTGGGGSKGAEASEKAESPVLEEAPPWVQALEARLREVLGTKVQIKNGPKYKGQVVIQYYGRDDLDRVVEAIAPKPMI